jgi:hypothetical protein
MGRRAAVAISLAVVAVAAALIGISLAGAFHIRLSGARAASTRTVASRRTRGTGSSTAPRSTRFTAHLHCFASPQRCGFPDPAAHYPSPSAVGPRNSTHSVRCASLQRSGSRTVTRAGTTLQDLNVFGRILVEAPNVTIRDVCVTDDASGNIANPPAVQFDATGGTISNSNVAGANATNESVEIALGENTLAGNSLTADHDYLHRCGECVHDDGWTLTNSYVVTNGDPCAGGYTGATCDGDPDHREDVYCDTGRFTAVHDTLLNPGDQTATLFCNTNNGDGGPCVNQVTLQDSLLAGGSFVVYACANASSPGSSQATITGNDFARCGTRSSYQPSTGGRTCGRADALSSDGRGYWPQGGYFGVADDTYCPGSGGGAWSDNRWDDTGARIGC